MRDRRGYGISLVLGTGQPLPLGLAILGSQIPDIDTTTSTIGKILYPISNWIEDRFPHRFITHSLLAQILPKSNPRRRLKTGRTGELWVLGIAIALLILGITIADSGGITAKVSQNLGLRDGIVRTYNENASTNKIYARIAGYWTSDAFG